MSELFPVQEMAMDSPRLKWKKKHQIQTRKNVHGDPEPWEAWWGDYSEALERQLGSCGHVYGPFLAVGETEEDALVQYSKSNGIKLWNEEGAST